jgi:hypothetical protein
MHVHWLILDGIKTKPDDFNMQKTNNATFRPYNYVHKSKAKKFFTWHWQKT